MRVFVLVRVEANSWLRVRIVVESVLFSYWTVLNKTQTLIQSLILALNTAAVTLTNTSIQGQPKGPVTWPKYDLASHLVLQLDVPAAGGVRARSSIRKPQCDYWASLPLNPQ